MRMVMQKLLFELIKLNNLHNLFYVILTHPVVSTAIFCQFFRYVDFLKIWKIYYIAFLLTFLGFVFRKHRGCVHSKARKLISVSFAHYLLSPFD